MAGNGNKIPHGYVFFKKLVSFIAQIIFGYIQLHAARKITQVRKSGLAHAAQLHNAPGGGYFGSFGGIFGFQAGLLFFAVGGIRVNAQGADGFYFLVALVDNFLQGVALFFGVVFRFRHKYLLNDIIFILSN